MPHILVVEDESSIADTLVYSLNRENYQTSWTTLGLEAIALCKKTPPDLILLDIGLPDCSGFEVCKAIRQFSDVPIIFLTARTEEIDVIVGLEIGADDYVGKPFSPREIIARVKTILRRRTSAAPSANAPACAFSTDEVKMTIKYNGVRLGLTRYEYRILKTLIQHPERVFSRTQLMEHAWDAPEHSLERTIDTHIKSLRAKLKSICPEQELIYTHRGVGYSLYTAID